MKLQATLGLLSAICISCVIASPDDESGAGSNKQCDRVVPVMPWRQSYRVKCTYLCKGWPFRYGNEPDGIACGVFQPITGKRNVCMDGECVPNYEFQNRRRFQRKRPTTRRAPTSKEGVTRYEPTSPKEHITTQLPKTAQVTSRNHYSTSESIFGTTTATDIKVSATTAPPAITTVPETTTVSATESPLTTLAQKARERTTRNIDRSVSKAITDTISLKNETPLTTQAHNVGDVSTTNIYRAVPKTISTTTSSVSKPTLTTQEEKGDEISTTNIGQDVPETVTATTSSASETTLTTRARKVGEVFTTSVRPYRKKVTRTTAHTFPIESNESTRQSIA